MNFIIKLRFQIKKNKKQAAVVAFCGEEKDVREKREHWHNIKFGNEFQYLIGWSEHVINLVSS